MNLTTYELYNQKYNQMCVRMLYDDFGNILSYNNEIFVQVIWNGELVPRYLVSNYGRFYDTKNKRFLSQSTDKDGYFRCTIFIDCVGKKTIRVNRIELLSFYPIDNYNEFVCNHKDGNKQNNFIGNLEWVTSIDNTRHGWDTGLNKNKGENHPLSVYTDEQIHTFCNYIDMGYKNYEICNMLNVSDKASRVRISATLSPIRNGLTHTDISMQYSFMNGVQEAKYSEMFAHVLCNFLSDGNIYTYKQLANYLQIPNEQRVYFRKFIKKLVEGDTYKNVSCQYKNLKLPVDTTTNFDYLYD